MSESPDGPRAKRARVDKGGRLAALAKLKELKGNKNKYEVDDTVDNVYEVVDEREYMKNAKEKYGGDWIEDDGTGYAEDGRDFFEDEEGFSGEDAAPSSNEERERRRKKRPRDSEVIPAKGKASLRNLFSNVVPKKAKAVSLAEDDILADILGELSETTKSDVSCIPQAEPGAIAPLKLIVPARITQIANKKADEALKKKFMNNFINSIKITETREEKTEDDELVDRILKSKPTEPNKKPAVVVAPSTVLCALSTHASENPMPPTQAVVLQAVTVPQKTKLCVSEETKMDFEQTITDENQQTDDLQPVKENNPKVIATATEADLDKLLCNWENICQMDNFVEEMGGSYPAATTAEQPNCAEDSSNDTALPASLKFWYWEAWEDELKRPGEVFLFGRTADDKSVCVRVEHIDRLLYLLPREFMLDPITKEATKDKVTLSHIYHEFDSELAAALKVGHYRTRKVTKNFAHHSIGVDVPQQSDYMEVRYDGKCPAPPQSIAKMKFNTIAHIFGTNTSPLERFLLERRIKGPCWLTLSQYKVNGAAMSWCKLDLSVNDPAHVLLADETKPAPPPTLTVLTLNVRTALNTKTSHNEICMIGMLVHNRFHIDRPPPQPAFTRHLCGFTRPALRSWPFDLAGKLAQYKSTRVHKHDQERSLLSWFLAQYQQIDADLVVSFDANDCQLDVLAERITMLKIPQWSRLGRLRMTQYVGKKLLDFFVGRMVCDVKRSAEECIRARSYDLQTLCHNVLRVREDERMEVNDDELLDFYESGGGVLRLISLTMQDASYVLRLMCELNILPLALQITNICGNVMTRTLQGGRSERNEFLLLHAFSEKNYIVPDKRRREWSAAPPHSDGGDALDATAGGSGRKKAAYAGGLVLEPVRGLYDKYVLLMDFNSLYPSIIQEYNICFTTVPQPYSLDVLPPLPDSGAETGILPQQLRRLVESRREVKKLMANADLSAELKLQYHIRQMALKLTANSMYGCLGFAQSRFFAQHLAALVTQKGREILTNTQALVQKMNHEVVYGDTDSLMVNTNITDYEQVFRIGHSIKQAVNKLYKQLELDIDGVFSCLLLLKKKKYAAVKVTKTAKGELQKEQEHKGLDIVRRDWSQVAIMVGKVVLGEVLSEKQLDEKLDAVHVHLEKIRDQLQEGSVPLPMFVITKQLSKGPSEFANAAAQAHVQVALRMNTTRNRRYKKGDMVDYVICDDGTSNAATQRAYHLDELKASATLRLDTHYYLAHQIHPVVTRMVEVLEGTDASRVADCLGLDPSKYRSAVQRSQQERSEDTAGEAIVKSNVQKFRQCEKFKFTCVACRTENVVASAFRPAANHTYEPVLQKCSNAVCGTSPHQYIAAVHNQLIISMRRFIQRFYQNWLVCDDPACNQNTRNHTHVTLVNRPVCMHCKNGTLLRQYTERDLYNQLSYYHYIFDLSKHSIKNAVLTPDAEAAYRCLREAVEQQLAKSAYCTISMAKLFFHFKSLEQSDEVSLQKVHLPTPREILTLEKE